MKTKRRLKKSVYNLIIVVLIAMLGYSVFNLAKIYFDGVNAKSSAKKIQEIKYEKAIAKSEETPVKSLKEINEDYIGWIKIDDTIIDYPIVQTTNNDYYLNHSFEKEHTKYGAIFADYRSDLSMKNNFIIYGHYMQDGQMFGALHKYKNQEFLKNHDVINLEINNQTYTYRVKIVAYMDLEKEGAFDYTDLSVGMKTYNELVKPFASYYEPVTDNVLILSTCASYTDDTRLFVVLQQE
ncbi:MAG: class B sortase [Erysipelotrichaceae bacterium]|nr:class B sortase [Erysipelotrichaceae bacterium]